MSSSTRLPNAAARPGAGSERTDRIVHSSVSSAVSSTSGRLTPSTPTWKRTSIAGIQETSTSCRGSTTVPAAGPRPPGTSATASPKVTAATATANHRATRSVRLPAGAGRAASRASTAAPSSGTASIATITASSTASEAPAGAAPPAGGGWAGGVHRVTATATARVRSSAPAARPVR